MRNENWSSKSLSKKSAGAITEEFHMGTCRDWQEAKHPGQKIKCFTLGGG